MLVEILVQAVTALQQHLPVHHSAFGEKDLAQITTRPPSSSTAALPAAMSVVTDVNGSQDIQAQSYVGFDSKSISTTTAFASSRT